MMFRKVLSSLIERVIGTYVEDINSEKLSFGLLNGNLSLSYINLKKDTLHRLLDLPLVLERGSVGRISVRIPYTHLWSQPWQLYIEDVDLVAYLSASDLRKRVSDNDHPDEAEQAQTGADGVPIEEQNESTNLSRVSLLDETALKQKAYLDQMEQKWWQTVHNTGVNDATALAAAVAMDSTSDKSSWWSYVASLGYNVIRNLQIEIHNVRLRIVQDPTGAIDSNGPVPPNRIPSALNFGAFTICLNHLTMKATDVEPQKDVESKLIEMDGLCMTWLGCTDDHDPFRFGSVREQDPASPNDVLYILPPIRLCGSLQRTRVQSDNTARIEFHTSLGELKVQLSCGFCRAAIQLAEFAVQQHRRLEQFDRRPDRSIRKSPRQWWQYAAYEIRPHLRSVLNSSSFVHTSLQALATEARANLVYVRAYSAHLLRGLTTACQPQPQPEQPSQLPYAPLPDAHTLRLNMTESSKADEDARVQYDSQWPVWRIAVLRLVAMRQAASKLHEAVKPTRRCIPLASEPRDTSASLDANKPLVPHGDLSSTTATATTTTDASSASTISWYAWWRYSSWLGLSSSWWSAADPPDVGGGTPICPPTGPTEIDPARCAVDVNATLTVKDTLFELLDELTMASERFDSTDRSELVPSSPDKIVSFRLVCHVEGCSIRLIDSANGMVDSLEQYMHAAFVSVSGQRMRFTLDARPWDQTVRFVAGVESFTVCDERARLSDENHTSNIGGAIFSSIIFPQQAAPFASTTPTRAFHRTSSFTRQTSHQAHTVGRPEDSSSTSTGLFWLAYEVAPSGAAFDYSLEMKTDPLYVVYQPELIKCVVNFFQTVAAAASPRLGTSARLQYQVIKQRTQANFRAMFDDNTLSPGLSVEGSAESPDILQESAPETASSSPGSLPVSFLSRPLSFRSHTTAVHSKPSRWRVNLDICAPRVLLPADDHFTRVSDVSSGHDALSVLRTSPDVTGLLCDFGHLRVTNWPLSADTTGFLSTTESTFEASCLSDRPDEDELFLTPCGSPETQSDNEDVNEQEDLIPKAERTSRNWSNEREMYESYVIYLADLHVLVGKLHELKKLGLWTDAEPITENPVPSPSVPGFSLGTPRLFNRLCLIDRLNLRLLVSRRIIPFPDLLVRCHPLTLTESQCPPTFWFTLEQERCVLQLSDTKIDNLLKCLQPSTATDEASLESVSEKPRADRYVLGDGMVQQKSTRTNLPERARVAEQSSVRASTEVLMENTATDMIGQTQVTDVFNTRRKRLIASFSVKELIIQMENKGYPIAECRLEGAAGTWIRLTGHRGAYQGRLVLRSLSVADALSNLGGDYDLIVASHQNVRLNNLSHLDFVSWSPRQRVQLNQAAENGVDQSPPAICLPPEGHMHPITAFATHNEQSGLPQDLIRAYFDWVPGVDVNKAAKATAPLGSRTVRVHVDCLDVVCNPDTLKEIHALLHHLSSLTEVLPGFYKRSVSVEHTADDWSSAPPSQNTLNLKMSLERISILLIDIIRPLINPDEMFDPQPVRKAEPLVLATVYQPYMEIHSASYRSALLRVAGIQVSDLEDSSSILRHLLTSTSAVVGPTDSDDPAIDVRLHWSICNPPPSISCASLTGVHCRLRQLTYVHRPPLIRRVHACLRDLVGPTGYDPPRGIPSDHRLSGFAQTHIDLEILTPVIIFPDQGTFRFLVTRWNTVRLTNTVAETVIMDAKSILVRCHLDRLQVIQIDLTQLPSVRSATLKNQTRWIYSCLHDLQPSDRSGVDAVLEPVSFTFWVTSLPDSNVDQEFPSWIKSPAFNRSMEEMAVQCSIPSAADSATTSEDVHAVEQSRLELITDSLLLECQFHTAVSLCLTKPVCFQLSQILHSFQLVEQPASDASENPQVPQSSSPRISCESEPGLNDTERHTLSKQFIAVCVHLPSLSLDAMAELDLDPVPLVRLQSAPIIACVSWRLVNHKIIQTNLRLQTHRLHLIDLLPTEPVSNSKPTGPTVPRVLLAASESPAVNGDQPLQPSVAAFPPDLPDDNTHPCVQHLAEPCHPAHAQTQPPRCTTCFGERDRFRDRIQRADGSPSVHVQAVLVNEPDPRLTDTFPQVTGFVKVNAGHLLYRLAPQSWVLILDFCGLNKSHVLRSDLDSHSETRTPTEDHTSRDAEGLTQSSRLTSVVVFSELDSFQLILTEPNPLRQPNPPQLSRDLPLIDADLTSITSHHVTLRVVSHVEQYEHWLFGERQNTPDNFMGPFYLVEGRLWNPSVQALCPRESRLYKERLRLISSPGETVEPIQFQLFLTHLAGHDRPLLGCDAYLWARIYPSIYYVHTQSLLTSLLDTINTFLQNRDLISNARASSEGFSVPTCQTSLRVLLDIVAQSPTLIVPVSSTSEECLVAEMSELTVRNEFHWVQQNPPYPGLQRVRDHTDVLISPPIASDNLGNSCPLCATSNNRAKPSSSSRPTDNKGPVLNDSCASDSQPESTNQTAPLNEVLNSSIDKCLLDQITLQANNVSIYPAHYRENHQDQWPPVTTSPGPIRFATYCICPRLGAHTANCPYLFDPRPMTFTLGRNLSAVVRSHPSVPDWRLSSRFHNWRVHLNAHVYAVLRGVLSHNFTGSSDIATSAGVVDVTNAFPGCSSWFERFDATANAFHIDQPINVPHSSTIQTSITGSLWTVITFWFDLRDVVLLFYPERVAAQAPSLVELPLMPYVQINFTRARFSFDQYSNHRSLSQLVCSQGTLTNMRSPSTSAPDEPLPDLFEILKINRPTKYPTAPEHAADPLESDEIQLRLAYTTSNHSSRLVLHAHRVRLTFDPEQLLRFARLISTEPAAPDHAQLPGDATVVHDNQKTDSSTSSTHPVSAIMANSNHHQQVDSTELYICLHDCDVVCHESLTQSNSTALVLHGSCSMLQRTRRTVFPNASSTRAHGCLHNFSVVVRPSCTSSASSMGPVSTVATVRFDLTPVSNGDKQVASSWRTATPSSANQRCQATPLPMYALFRGGLAVPAGTTHSGLQYSVLPIRPDRLVLSCCTTTLRLTLCRKSYDCLVSVIAAAMDHCRTISSDVQLTKPTDSEAQICDEVLDKVEPLRAATSAESGPVSNSIALLIWPELISNAVSCDLHAMELTTRLSLSMFESTTDGLVPLFESRVERLNMDWRRLPNPTGVAMISGLSVNYFNRDLICWEPAVEPWSCSIEWNRTVLSGFEKITNISVSSCDPLNLNLTVPLALLIRKLYNAWKAAESLTPIDLTDTRGSSSDCAQKKKSPLRLSNQTGSIVWYQLVQPDTLTSAMERQRNVLDSAPNAWHKVNCDSALVDVSTSNGDVRFIDSVTPKTASPIAPSAAASRLSHRWPRLAIQVAGWKAAFPISVDRPGVFFRTLERQEALEIDLDESCWAVQHNLPSYTRLIIEVVRTGPLQHVVILRSGLTITNDLSPGHNLLVGFQLTPVEADRSGDDMGVDDVWSSQLDGTAGLTGSVDKRIPLLTVESGQTAAVPLNLAAAASAGLGFLCFCPTGRIPVPSNPTSVLRRPASERPLTVNYSWTSVCLPCAVSEQALDTGTQIDGRRPGTESESRLVQLSVAEASQLLDWTRLKQPDDLVELVLVADASLLPGQTGLSDVPLIINDANSLSPPPRTSHHTTPDRTGQSQPHPYHMCLAVVRDHFPPDPLWVGLPGNSEMSHSRDRLLPRQLPGHHFTIGPTVRITNLLPYELTYYFHGTSVAGEVAVGADACIYELSPMALLNFGVRLEGFPKCEPLSIPPNSYNERVLLRLHDTLDRVLELQVQVLSRAGGPRHLTVSAVVWLVNESGLPLVFAQSPSQSVSKQQQRKALASIAAGQYGEHEQARSVAPLLFSFAKKSEGHVLRVRLGRGASGRHRLDEQASQRDMQGGDGVSSELPLYPVWSPGISLEKTGVDMLQLKLLDRSNRPDLVYHVGFEVRQGCGRHSVTTIVTFKPRYVVENRSGLKLQVGQLRCPKTRSGDPAFVTLSDGSTQAFHWPRDDLDRLLCVRACPDEATQVMEQNLLSTGSSPAFTLWSGGFQIDRPYATTLMLRLLPNTQLPGTMRHLMSASPSVDRLFLRVVIVLRAATFHVVLQNANCLPPPFRLENASLVALSYHQEVNLSANDSTPDLKLTRSRSDSQRLRVSSSETAVDHEQLSLASPQSQSMSKDLSQTGARDSRESDPVWLGGIASVPSSYLGPETSVAYALDEPHCSPSLVLSVQGGMSATYSLDKVGLGKTLIYDNFIYLTVLGPLSDHASSSARHDSLSCDLVFDVVPGSQRVIYSSKIPGRRAQLWWLSNSGHIYHEGSSSPLEPGERMQANRGRQSTRPLFVLDVDVKAGTAKSSSSVSSAHVLAVTDAETNSQFEVVQLIVAPLNKRRKLYQTWHIDQHGLLVNGAMFCVQIYRMNAANNKTDRLELSELIGTPTLAAKPRASATRLISPTLAPAIVVPLWLRPGSGRLRVYLYLDGVTRVLRVEDAADRSSLLDPSELPSEFDAPDEPNPSRWGNPLFLERMPTVSRGMSPWLNRQLSNTSVFEATHFKAIFSLPSGIGISIISAFAEELIYASLLNIRLAISRLPALDTSGSFPSVFNSQAASLSAHNGLNVAGDVLFDSSDQVVDDSGASVASTATDSHEHDDNIKSEWDLGCVDFRSVTSRNYLANSVELSIGHIQIDSQFPGASFPVLLFADNFSSVSGTLVSEPSHTSTTDSHAPHQASSKRSVVRGARSSGRTAIRPTLVISFEREVQNRWNVHLFKTMRVRASPIVIQAEELLLLKLIQFWQHVSHPVPNASIALDEQVHPRPSPPALADDGTLVWFDRFFIAPILIRLSVQTAKHSLTSSNLAGAKRLLPSLMSFTNADVRLGPVERVHMLESAPCLLEQLLNHYHMQLHANAVHIFGSVDFLGNPIGLINDLTSGISGLVEFDVGSLIRHVAHGVGDSTAKVLGSVSQLLNAISLDERHQLERAAILGVRADTAPLWSSRRSGPSYVPSQHKRHSQTGADPTIASGSAQLSVADESLDDFELTRYDGSVGTYTDGDASSESSNRLGETGSTRVVSANDSNPLDIDQAAIAPLTAGFRGFMHGLVGGMTSMVTQPYRGIQEDQFKGFMVGVGRGLLGTVTKPLGGIFDLFSGAMTTLSEVARSSGQGRPRRRRPRRSGLSKYALVPLTLYRLDEAVAQLQLHQLTLFTSLRQSLSANTLKHAPTGLLEIGEEISVDESNGDGRPPPMQTVVTAAPSPTQSIRSVSGMIHATVDAAWLSHTFHYPECVFHVLPVQETGVVAIVTDRAVWCVSNASLRNWVSSKHHACDRSVPVNRMHLPTFYLTEHATLMFMLPYRRLDEVYVLTGPWAPVSPATVASPTRATSTTVLPAPNPVYVVFVGDGGVSTQQLRCDSLPWGLNLAAKVREAQFRYIQAAFSLFRTETPAASSSAHQALSRPWGVPLVPSHPMALSYAPTTNVRTSSRGSN